MLGLKITTRCIPTFTIKNTLLLLLFILPIPLLTLTINQLDNVAYVGLYTNVFQKTPVDGRLRSSGNILRPFAPG